MALLQVLGDVGTVYGVFDGAISIFGSIKDTLFPEAAPEEINKFKVFVGMVREETDDESKSTAGHAPALAIWNVNGGFIDSDIPNGGAFDATPKIKDGESAIYELVGLQEPDYLSVVQRGPDGVCIHLIIGTSVSAGRQFMWTGDMGKVCGAPWYAQDSPITDGERPYVPACVWIDGNGSDGHIWKGFNLHLGSFPGSNTEKEDVAAAKKRTAEAWDKNRDLLCASEPRFSMYEDIKIGNSIQTYDKLPSEGGDPGSEEYKKLTLGEDNWRWGEKVPHESLPLGPNGKTPAIVCVEEECPPKGPSWNRNLKVQGESLRMTRRQRQDNTVAGIKKRQILHADRLIVSNMRQHSAIELCDSPYSLGPDMAAVHEGMFCDMSEKQLWPICVDGSASYCFDMDSQTVRGSDQKSNSTLPSGDKPLWTNKTTEAVAAVNLAVHDSSTTGLVTPSKSYTTVKTWG